MNKRFFFIISLYLSFFLSLHVQAQEVSEPLHSLSSDASSGRNVVVEPLLSSAPVQSAGAGLISQNLESVSISLAIVLLVIFLLAWLVRKAAPSSFGGAKGQMKILSVLSLGGKERIMLVDVAGTQMVLGVSASGVSCLHVFAEPIDLARQVSPKAQGFQAVLQDFIANKATNKDSD